MCWVSFMTAGPIKLVKRPLRDFKIAWMSMRKIASIIVFVPEKTPGGMGFYIAFIFPYSYLRYSK